jgi:hypothetical protein
MIAHHAGASSMRPASQVIEGAPAEAEVVVEDATRAVRVVDAARRAHFSARSNVSVARTEHPGR